jgi:ABC-type amino acid transport substrate-binding protein
MNDKRWLLIILLGGHRMKKVKLGVVLALVLGIMLTLVGCGGSKEKTQILRYENTPVALTELLNSGVDAVVADRPVVLAYLENNPQAGVVAFGDDGFEIENYGVAMRQADTDLHALINNGLAKVIEKGIYDKIQNMYFGDGADYVVGESTNTLDKKYIVAMDAAYAPFEWVDEKTGEIVGFDADLIKAIAAEMGFAVELRHFEWDGIIASLLSGNADLIISAMTITEERQKSVTFSSPYFEATQYIAVKEGSSIKSLEDLRGKKIGVQNGTTGDLFVSDYFEK